MRASVQLFSRPSFFSLLLGSLLVYSLFISKLDRDWLDRSDDLRDILYGMSDEDQIAEDEVFQSDDDAFDIDSDIKKIFAPDSDDLGWGQTPATTHCAPLRPAYADTGRADEEAPAQVLCVCKHQTPTKKEKRHYF
uniref:Uncharacterized protein n=1 Tax=Cuerna arida TaxID=1464854 RepID=A0A1B6G099_9HEMI